mgnify:CR=1 FL=1
MLRVMPFVRSLSCEAKTQGEGLNVLSAQVPPTKTLTLVSSGADESLAATSQNISISIFSDMPSGTQHAQLWRERKTNCLQ